jgi:hypothetical protein
MKGEKVEKKGTGKAAFRLDEEAEKAFEQRRRPVLE